MSWRQMSYHTCCLGIERVCEDKLSRPLRQLNAGYIETVVDSNLMGLHLPLTATADKGSGLLYQP